LEVFKAGVELEAILADIPVAEAALHLEHLVELLFLVGYILFIARVVALEHIPVFLGFPPPLAVVFFSHLVLVPLVVVGGILHATKLADVTKTSGREEMQSGLKPKFRMDWFD
jgi:hypothetical protein